MDSDVVVYGFNYIGANMMEKQIYETYKIFKTFFPHLERNVSKWEQIEIHAVKILLTWGKTLIFTYENEGMWSLETEESYIINKMKGG